ARLWAGQKPDLPGAAICKFQHDSLRIPSLQPAARSATLASMPPKRKGPFAANLQLPLRIQDSEQSAAFVCRGIFSANYLNQHFGKSEEFQIGRASCRERVSTSVILTTYNKSS